MDQARHQRCSMIAEVSQPRTARIALGRDGRGDVSVNQVCQQKETRS